MNIDIVIINYNTTPLVLALLDRIRETAPEARLIVVDNASTDQAGPWLLKEVALGTTVIGNEENRGFAVAANQGAGAGQGEAIGFLNPDIVLSDDWFYHISSAFRDPRVMLAAPQIVDDRGGTYPPLSWQYPCGSCLFLRRDAWERLGGFDEKYFFGWEDIDLVRRAYLADMLMRWVPEISVTHLGMRAPRPREWGGDYDPASRKYFEWRWTEMKALGFVKGGAFIIGVPSRDLTLEDMIQIKEVGWTKEKLVASGLYVEVEEEKPKKVFEVRVAKAKRKPKAKGVESRAEPEVKRVVD